MTEAEAIWPSILSLPQSPRVSRVSSPALWAAASKIRIAVAAAVRDFLGLLQLGRVAGLGGSDGFSVRCPIPLKVLPVSSRTALVAALTVNVSLAFAVLDVGHHDRA